MRLLAARFDHRLTTMTGAAGFGKTTALALAVENNHLDPFGRDVWLGATLADNDADHLIAGFAHALDIDPVGDRDDTIRRIYDSIWTDAPTDVVLIVDDAHLVTSAESLGVVASLLADMPANGHLLLSGRTPTEMPTEVGASGAVLKLTEADLALDDEELQALVAHRQSASPESLNLPRHAATADLQLAAGSSASIDFLWEEILTAIPTEQLAQLKRCAVLQELDDEIVAHLTSAQFDAAALVHDIPLVEVHTNGSRRMHALLREALVSRLDRPEYRSALTAAGEIERQRERHDKAIMLFLSAGNEILALDTARDFVLLPTLQQDMESISSIRRVIEPLAPGSATAAALKAASLFGGQEAHVAVLFERCAERARAEGDDALEAQSLLRILQARWVNMTDEPPGLQDRLIELSATNDFAKGVLAHTRSFNAQFAGDIAAALAALDDYHYWGPSIEMVLRSTRLCDLGRPELVGDGLAVDDLAALPGGAQVFVGLGMWLRGDASPELAHILIADMTTPVIKGGFTHPIVAVLGVATAVALAAGDLSAARRHADHAADITATGVGSTVALCSHIAAASLAAVTNGDEAAAALLDPKVTGLGMPGWPLRPQLLALPLIYLTRPETRAVLDGCDFGPAITAAVAAGRALVALREGNDIDLAERLAKRLQWSHPNLLRVHVLPHHLAELACATVGAGSNGIDDSPALAMLRSLPDVGGLLRRVVRDSNEPAVSVAQGLLGEYVRQPPDELAVSLIGPIVLHRNGQAVTDADWQRRPKVRELCALLVQRRRVDRFEVIELMWPDQHDEAKSLRSLRSTLSLLQAVLEPNRQPGTEPFFLRTDGDSLIADASLRCDVDAFESLVEQAKSDDQAGLPARALETYQGAVALYRGDYLDAMDTSWTVLTRLRLRSLALDATCRVAELIAAKGEPEESARVAREALLIDPGSERAGRLLVAAFDASGDRSAASEAAQHLRDVLVSSGVAPTTQTSRLLDRLTR
jgi:DNA-binding SARP family transcriptional activator